MPLIMPRGGAGTWFHSVEQSLLQDDVDIKRLWENTPSIPNPNQGVPFFGQEIATRFQLPSPSSGSSSSAATPCMGCATTPRQWSVSFSGITNNSCATCTDFNATWILDHAPLTGTGGIGDIGCKWAATIGICEAPDASFLGNMKMYRDTGSGLWWLVIGFSGLFNNAVYTQVVGSFDCTAPNTMLRATPSTLAKCSGWPPAITVTPIL